MNKKYPRRLRAQTINKKRCETTTSSANYPAFSTTTEWRIPLIKLKATSPICYCNSAADEKTPEICDVVCLGVFSNCKCKSADFAGQFCDQKVCIIAGKHYCNLSSGLLKNKINRRQQHNMRPVFSRCDKNVNIARLYPNCDCQNGGTQLNGRCLCPSGFKGDLCQNNLNNSGFLSKGIKNYYRINVDDGDDNDDSDIDISGDKELYDMNPYGQNFNHRINISSVLTTSNQSKKSSAKSDIGIAIGVLVSTFLLIIIIALCCNKRRRYSAHGHTEMTVSGSDMVMTQTGRDVNDMEEQAAYQYPDHMRPSSTGIGNDITTTYKFQPTIGYVGDSVRGGHSNGMCELSQLRYQEDYIA